MGCPNIAIIPEFFFYVRLYTDFDYYPYQFYIEFSLKMNKVYIISICVFSMYEYDWTNVQSIYLVWNKQSLFNKVKRFQNRRKSYLFC